jgi:hypothetical protein
MRFSVETVDALTCPCGSPVAPARPSTGVSERRTHGEPTNWSRASANRATMSGLAGPPSGGAATVIRMCCTSRSVGVLSVALG